MSFESFLNFWSLHNRQIIEFVFVATFVIILYVIYRQFFAKSESQATAGSGSNSVSIDTSEIEEKLKKILENQSSFKTHSGDALPSASAADVVPVAASNEDLEKLKTDIKEKEKVIEELKKSAPAGGASKEDSKKLEEKIKELEGRLQEYEIISEDIADLSFYKEENARLQKELGSGGGAKPAAAAVAQPSAVPAPEPAAPKEEPPQPAPAAVAAAIPEPPPPAPAAPPPSPVAAQPTPAPAVAPVTAEEAAVIDDDILKEFAAAVEGQKQAEAVVEIPQAVDEQKLTESKELMGEFENFIKKG